MEPRDLAETQSWFDSAVKLAAQLPQFARVEKAIIWTDQRDEAGLLVVETDAEALAASIRQGGYPLYWGHDPGAPIGRAVDAKFFVAPDGTQFVAGVLGIYDPSSIPSFKDCGADPTLEVELPRQLPDMLPESHIAVAYDPREVSQGWLDGVLKTAPLSVKQQRLSHNAADSLSELIRIGLPYVALVWNPFVNAFATEAGKDAYAALHNWLRGLWSSLSKCKNPTISLQSTQSGCEVSFLLRGKSVAQHYAAHEALPLAAARASKLIETLRAHAMPIQSLVYEFDVDGSRWYPAHATLEDGRLIAEPTALVALERGEYELSLGIGAT